MTTNYVVGSDFRTNGSTFVPLLQFERIQLPKLPHSVMLSHGTVSACLVVRPFQCGIYPGEDWVGLELGWVG